MRKALIVSMLGVVAVIAAAAVSLGTADAKKAPKSLPRVVVYVESQGLCYDSIVTAQNLPAHGPFQDLEMDAADHCGSGLKTAYGPGDQGYVGGRWLTPDGSRFLCPLLGPGYSPAD